MCLERLVTIMYNFATLFIITFLMLRLLITYNYWVVTQGELEWDIALHVCRWWNYKKTQCNVPDPQALKVLPLPRLQYPLSLRNRRCFVDVSIGNELQLPKFTFWLVMLSHNVSVAKGSLLDGWGLHLSAGKRTGILECS